MAGANRVYSPTYLPPAILKSHDSAAGTSTGILTWHTKDLEGEIIRPAGVRLNSKQTYPVDWLHDIYVGKGFADRKDIRDRNEDGSEVWRRDVPMGTTHFFRKDADLEGFDCGRFSKAECVDAGNQAAELVLADIAPGISIEIEPLSKVRIGDSLVKGVGVPAYRYDDSRLRGWAHTPPGRQVQPWAQTLIDKALEAGRSGKLPGGGAMLPTIRKAFDSLLAAHPSPASVSVPRTVKAMPQDYPPMDAAADAPAPMAEEAPVEQQGTATSKAAYTLTQALSDAVAAVTEMMKDGEHVKGKAKLAKLLADVESVAEEASAVGDMVASDVTPADAADADSDDDSVDDTEGDVTDEEDTDGPPEKKKGEEKALKIVPLKKSLDGALITATGYVPRRFGHSDVKEVSKATDADEFDRLFRETMALEISRPAPRRTRANRT